MNYYNFNLVLKSLTNELINKYEPCSFSSKYSPILNITKETIRTDASYSILFTVDVYKHIFSILTRNIEEVAPIIGLPYDMDTAEVDKLIIAVNYIIAPYISNSLSLPPLSYILAGQTNQLLQNDPLPSKEQPRKKKELKIFDNICKFLGNIFDSNINDTDADTNTNTYNDSDNNDSDNNDSNYIEPANVKTINIKNADVDKYPIIDFVNENPLNIKTVNISQKTPEMSDNEIINIIKMDAPPTTVEKKGKYSAFNNLGTGDITSYDPYWKNHSPAALLLNDVCCATISNKYIKEGVYFPITDADLKEFVNLYILKYIDDDIMPMKYHIKYWNNLCYVGPTEMTDAEGNSLNLSKETISKFKLPPNYKDSPIEYLELLCDSNTNNEKYTLVNGMIKIKDGIGAISPLLNPNLQLRKDPSPVSKADNIKKHQHKTTYINSDCIDKDMLVEMQKMDFLQVKSYNPPVNQTDNQLMEEPFDFKTPLKPYGLFPSLYEQTNPTNPVNPPNPINKNDKSIYDDNIYNTFEGNNNNILRPYNILTPATNADNDVKVDDEVDTKVDAEIETNDDKPISNVSEKKVMQMGETEIIDELIKPFETYLKDNNIELGIELKGPLRKKICADLDTLYFKSLIENIDLKVLYEELIQKIKDSNYDRTNYVDMHINMKNTDAMLPYKLDYAFANELVEYISRNKTNSRFMLFADLTDEELKSLVELVLKDIVITSRDELFNMEMNLDFSVRDIEMKPSNQLELILYICYKKLTTRVKQPLLYDDNPYKVRIHENNNNESINNKTYQEMKPAKNMENINNDRILSYIRLRPSSISSNNVEDEMNMALIIRKEAYTSFINYVSNNNPDLKVIFDKYGERLIEDSNFFGNSIEKMITLGDDTKESTQIDERIYKDIHDCLKDVLVKLYNSYLMGFINNAILHKEYDVLGRNILFIYDTNNMEINYRATPIIKIKVSDEAPNKSIGIMETLGQGLKVNEYNKINPYLIYNSNNEVVDIGNFRYDNREPIPDIYNDEFEAQFPRYTPQTTIEESPQAFDNVRDIVERIDSLDSLTAEYNIIQRPETMPNSHPKYVFESSEEE